MPQCASGRLPMMLTLGQAAKLTALNKTTLNRAIRGGRLSAQRRDDGSYLIDVSELERVYPIRSVSDASDAQDAPESVPGRVRRCAQPENQPSSDARIAALEAQVAALHASIERERHLLEDALQEARSQRDKWQAQAERLALAAPKIEPAQRGWWLFRRTA